MAAFLFGCKKENDSTPNTMTVKYEIVTTGPRTGAAPTIQYTDGSGKTLEDHTFSSGSTWSKTVTISRTGELHQFALDPGSYEFSSPGTLTTNLYVDGKKEMTADGSTAGSSGYYTAFGAVLTYGVQF